MILGKENSFYYFFIRNNITGWLANIYHRWNIADESQITNVKINKVLELLIVQSDNRIACFMGVTAISLYQ
jgi:hypothetical protein